MSRQLRAREPKSYNEGKQVQSSDSEEDAQSPQARANTITRFTQQGVRNTDKVCPPDVGKRKASGRQGSKKVLSLELTARGAVRLTRTYVIRRRKAAAGSEESDEERPRSKRGAKEPPADRKDLPARAGRTRASLEELDPASDPDSGAGARLAEPIHPQSLQSSWPLPKLPQASSSQQRASSQATA